MKLNIQLFGGRGQNSKGKRTKQTTNKQSATKEKVSLNIPEGVSKGQERVLTKLYDNTLNELYGSTKDSYELKRFNITNESGITSVVIEAGLKNDEGTLASALARNTAIFFIGKNGGLKHFDGSTNKLKPTKTWYGAFYDYEKRKK